MQTLTVTPKMRAFIGGAFYPTGFSLIMYPSEDGALEVARRLTDHLFRIEDIFLVPPTVVLQEIAPTVDASDKPLPSMGSDGSIARGLVELAEQGHVGLLVRTSDDQKINALRGVIANSTYSFAKAYHSLAIEDL